MGRKSSLKSKERRQQRKEERQRISLAKAAVDKANALLDPLEPFPVFRSFHKNGLDLRLYVKKVTELPDDTKQWIFDLTKRNMQKLYDTSGWIWNDDTKREELTEEAAWYLIAEGTDGTLVGFSHFRFDLEDGIEVLYCYELQLESSFVRKGLGKFMMQILELIGFTNNMKKVVLTVLKRNPNNVFFKKLNYEIDEFSPIDDLQELCYEILSKVNKRLVNTSLPPKSITTNEHSHCHINGCHDH